MKTPHRRPQSIRASSVEVLETRLTPGSLITPNVVSIIHAATPADSSSVVYTVTFDQAVSGVDATDFDVVTSGNAHADAAVSVASTGDAKVFLVAVDGLQGNGGVQLNLVEKTANAITFDGNSLGGNGVGDGSFSGTIFQLRQQGPKVVSMTGSGSLNITGSTASWLVTFSENVTGVDATDFNFVTSGATSTSNAPSVTQQTPSTYLVTATGITGAGTIALRLSDDGTIVDSAGNRLQTSPVSFAAPSQVDSGNLPISVATGDINNDGKTDILSVDHDNPSVRVLLGNGDGSFTQMTNVAVGTQPTAIVIADVNGDGKPDAITTGYTSESFPTYASHSVSVLLGNGDGTFQASRNAGSYSGQYYDVAVADFDKDGNPDIVYTNRNFSGFGLVNVMKGDGTGSFAAPTQYPTGNTPVSVAVGDLNGDGNPDVVTADISDNAVYVRLGVGGGNLGSSTSFATGVTPTSVALGDLDGDGDLDAVTTNFDGTVSVLLGDGAGSFGTHTETSTGTTRPSHVVLSDVDGDGLLDIVSTSGVTSQVSGILGEAGAPNGAVSVLRNVGSGSFASALVFDTNSGDTLGVAIGDFNGDGRADIVASGGQGSLPTALPETLSTVATDVLLNNGTGTANGDVFNVTPMQVDLTVSIDNGVTGLATGGSTTFTIAYGNIGNAGATGVTLTVNIAEHFYFLASENPGWFKSGDTLTKTIEGTLDPKESGTELLKLHVNYVINGSYASGYAQVTISDDGTHGSDANTDNNSDSDYDGIQGLQYSGFIVVAPGIAPKNKYAPPVVKVYDRATNEFIYAFNAYETRYRDSVRVAVGDFNRDGFDDIVTTTQHNGGRMRFFDGASGQQFDEGALSQEIPVFGRSKNTGAFVAVGDLNGYGLPEVIVGSSLISRTVGGGTVKVYSLDGFDNAQPDHGASEGFPTLQVIKEFKPFGARFKGGVRVAAGDVDFFGNRQPEALPESGKQELTDDLVVGQGYRGNTVKVYNGLDLLNTPSTVDPTPMGTFTVGGARFRGGVSVAVGDVNGDNHADIIVGRNTGRPSVVEVFDGSTIIPNFAPLQIGTAINPFDTDPLHPKNTFGVRVASTDVDDDGYMDIVVTVGLKTQSLVKFYLARPTMDGFEFVLDPERDTLVAYDTFLNSAVWVAASSFQSRK